jgi:hypothetical protein
VSQPFEQAVVPVQAPLAHGTVVAGRQCPARSHVRAGDAWPLVQDGCAQIFVSSG